MSTSRLALLLPLMLGLAAGAASARTLEVGPDKTYKTPSAAIAAAHDGDHVTIAAGEYYDCASVPQSNIVIEGTGPDASAIMTDKACAGKGMLVTDGHDITIRNLTLTRARVPDGNGAGIRAEGTNLVVDGVKFINNQNGILANDDLNSTITVRNSEFTRNGTCDPLCAHGIYANHIAKLVVQNSKFLEEKIGHHIKSRALVTEVTGCDIADGQQGTSSYLIEVPNGGTLIVRDNKLEKGPRSDNHAAAINIGAEGVNQPTRQITVENNSFRNDGSYSTFLLYNFTATEAALKGNKLSGQIQALHGDGEVQ